MQKSSQKELAGIIVFILAIGYGIGLLAPDPALAHKVTPRECSKVASMYGKTKARGIRTTCTRNAKRHDARHYCKRLDLRPLDAIKCVFPPQYQATAWRVAKCESTADAGRAISRARGLGRWAKNGQYIGVAQIGTAERAQHGNYSVGASATIQARTFRSLHRSRGFQPWNASRHCWGAS